MTTRQPTAHYHRSQQELTPANGPGWQRRPGRPRHSWIQQIGDGTPFSVRAEWSKACRRGHSGLTQRTSVSTRSDNYHDDSRSGLAWSLPHADRGLSRPTSVFRTTIGVCKILSRSVETWQYEGQKPVSE